MTAVAARAISSTAGLPSLPGKKLQDADADRPPSTPPILYQGCNLETEGQEPLLLELQRIKVFFEAYFSRNWLYERIVPIKQKRMPK
jgi:hypothetical protein